MAVIKKKGASYAYNAQFSLKMRNMWPARAETRAEMASALAGFVICGLG